MSPDPRLPELTVLNRRELAELEERADFWRRAALLLGAIAAAAVAALLLR